MKSRLSTKLMSLTIGTVVAMGCATTEDTESEASPANPADGSGGTGDGEDDGPGDGTTDPSNPRDGADQPRDGDPGTEAGANCAGDVPAELEDLITDFEDGTVGVNQVEGRGGGFYIFNDQDNDPVAQEFEVLAVSRCSDQSSIYAFCTRGSGFISWGAGFGTDLGVLDPVTMEKSSVDLSAYRGISFWLKANPGSTAPAMKVMIPDVNTAAEGGGCTTDGGAPKTEQCDAFVKNVPVPATWTKVEVLFDDLRQGGWGKGVPSFSKDAVYGIQLQFAPGTTFDVCFDQLVLMR